VEGVGHALHLAVVVVHVEVALDEGPKRNVEVESAGLAIADELLLDGKPSLMNGVAELMDDVLELDGERAEEPGENDVVHPSSLGRAATAVSEMMWSSRV
jgi:hypothetical protein